MRTLVAAHLTAAIAITGLAAGTNPRPAASQAAAGAAAVSTVAQQNALVKAGCVGCHNDAGRSGGLSLQDFDAARIEQKPDIAEKMIRKLRAGMMPPPTVRNRPEPATLTAFAADLEGRIDRAAAGHIAPGSRPFQRLNRAEYANAIRDLLTLNVDVTAFLPADVVSDGFDNIADAQSFSPALLEGYLRAASHISRLAVGDRTATPSSVTFQVSQGESQMPHVEGAPYGTRGGLSVVHAFPADGGYVFKAELHHTANGELFGRTILSLSGRDEQLVISVNDERVATLAVGPKMSESDPNGMVLETAPVQLAAGPQHIAAAFIQRFAGPFDDVMAPIDRTLADSKIGEGVGITTLPHLTGLTITGPAEVTGVSDTPSRRRIFSCHPAGAGPQQACAAAIVKRLATQAYRGIVGPKDLDPLMRLYEQGRAQGGFETGVRLAIHGILTNPRFLFRAEQVPADATVGGTYRLTDVDLASRLSFFLWASVPDAELVRMAVDGRLKNPAMLEKQVRRMLADPRAEALSTRFAAQWLRLQDVEKLRPDSLLFPDWDRRLSESFLRETELFFDSLVREDRSLLELLTADYSFVDGRLARHYGIPYVTGSAFRRVTLPETRRGILGQGSVLMLTSVADRTSPVQRGKWIMQVLFGTPPPPPPPNVPAFETIRTAAGSRVLSVRERMEEHRANPACNSCHRVIDPLGLALENFDVTGKWRIKDTGVPVDSSGVLYDGTAMNGPAGLRQALLKHADMIVRSFTESLLTYALGRRVESSDMPAVRAIVRAADTDGNRLSAFILGVIATPQFRMAELRAPTTTAGAQP